MITSLEIYQYIDSCVNNYKNNFKPGISNDDTYDFLMFKYSPKFSHFQTKYRDLTISKKIESELMNMNELYMKRCENFKSESK